jgi:hypothetical protein
MHKTLIRLISTYLASSACIALRLSSVSDENVGRETGQGRASGSVYVCTNCSSNGQVRRILGLIGSLVRAIVQLGPRIFSHEVRYGNHGHRLFVWMTGQAADRELHG